MKGGKHDSGGEPHGGIECRRGVERECSRIRRRYRAPIDSLFIPEQTIHRSIPSRLRTVKDSNSFQVEVCGKHVHQGHRLQGISGL